LTRLSVGAGLFLNLLVFLGGFSPARFAAQGCRYAQGKVLMKGICDYVLKHSSSKTIERVAAALRGKPSWAKAAQED
jgi:hypothetical protein